MHLHQRMLLVAFLTMVSMVASQVNAGLVITEIMYDPFTVPSGPIGPVVDSSTNQWIEVFNTGPVGLNLSDYKLVNGADESFGVLPNEILAPNEAIVFYNSTFAQTGPTTFDYTLFPTEWWGFGYTQRAVALHTWRPMMDDLNPVVSKTLKLVSNGPPETTLVSLVNFDSVSGGWPAPVNGYSIYLSNLNDPSPGNWSTVNSLTAGYIDPEVGNYGSPGFVEFAASSLAVPEPSSMVIFGFMVSTAPLLRRRNRQSGV